MVRIAITVGQLPHRVLKPLANNLIPKKVYAGLSDKWSNASATKKDNATQIADSVNDCNIINLLLEPVIR